MKQRNTTLDKTTTQTLSKTAKKMLCEAGFKESEPTPEGRIELQDEANDRDQGIMILDGILWWKQVKGDFPEGAMRG